MARPGKLQSTFSAGEVDPLIHEREELKYVRAGVRLAENVEFAPQGGFRVRDGLRDVGELDDDAGRLKAFNASDGSAYDIVFRPGSAQAWGETGIADSFNIAGLTEPMLPEFTVAQQLDTMLVFHEDLETPRIRALAPDDWQVDTAPFVNIPNYDFGADINGDPYANGVPAEWTLEFTGLTDDVTVFILTISGQDTTSIVFNSTTTALDDLVQAAILALPNTYPGITAVADGSDIVITFAGEGNEGDGWAVSGRVVNKADAAVLSHKTVAGVAPGEPVMSADRGWPQCGAFYGQRLLIGGFKSLPNAWAFSLLASYFNFDERFAEANGPALVPMETPGGERIEQIVAGRDIAIFTSLGEYWLAERGLSKSEPPNHVKASSNGTQRGVPVIDVEGSLLYMHRNGGVVGEFRYTDLEGNYVSADISLVASHLIDGVIDMALKRATISRDGNQLALVQSDGAARLATILREQEITAFSRITSQQATFISASNNARNEIAMIVQRPSSRRLERFEEGLLLDEAQAFAFETPNATIGGLDRFTGREIWCIADGHVFGPFTLIGSSLTLPIEVSQGEVGTWMAPVVQTLPLSRMLAQDVVLKKRGRIHTVQLELVDTTSIAISVNGKALSEVDLVRFGAEADVPELERSFTGRAKVSGLTGYSDDPYVTISQTRPGRMTVRSITIEAAL